MKISCANLSENVKNCKDKKHILRKKLLQKTFKLLFLKRDREKTGKPQISVLTTMRSESSTSLKLRKR